uniref:Uncharacterized protein n=1 Tax=Candidatus Methanogaster sp. ANME-2c ERB4 TaxID=2759911 RepID=A0A7G9Y0E6_9EURY|nr:hypothetical protein PCHDJDJP_00002 [Methanosarcinales archaeon ANME-2c ERB4]QNO42088.1 hypothetical protein NOEFNAIN_00020 [Methanosarcinales archaeon ANME-2c ERB4]QNO42642.1 hypothetical protein LNAFDGMD_00002 [Methanosarcinales archaeon ANME-2c ERB4]QNO48253.1 hypothetical protein BHCKGNAA_00039 [Methanosarcinales archaeon ANME-2c ERB4]
MKILCQVQISHDYVRGAHDSDIASIGWNLSTLLIYPVMDRFSVHRIIRVYGLGVVRNTVTVNTEVVGVSRHSIVRKRVVARILYPDAVVVVRCGVARKRVVAARISQPDAIVVVRCSVIRNVAVICTGEINPSTVCCPDHCEP